MEFLVALLVVFLVFVAITLGGLALGVWALRRHNRVSPSVATGAPLVWLWSPSTPARTHRRLRTAAATARRVPRRTDAPANSRSALSVDLERQAIALDEWVVWTAKAPGRWRRDHYRAIQARVRQLEGLTMRLSDLDDDGPHRSIEQSGHELDEASERLAALEQAHAEVRALERLTLGTAPLPPQPSPVSGEALLPAPAARPAPPTQPSTR